MKVLVLGARGMLGSDVMRAATDAGHEVRGFGHTELDITDPEALKSRFELDRPDAVINCAAWTDVDGAEDDPEGAQLVNGTGAGNASAAAARVGAKIIYVSSDYVFAGDKGDDYVEADQVGPISVYGQSKLAGEVATATANRRSSIVRSSWLFGINGPNFVNTMIRLGESQGQVLVVHDQVGSPTYTWHLAYGLVRLLDSDEFGIHHVRIAQQLAEFQVDVAHDAGIGRAGLAVFVHEVVDDAVEVLLEIQRVKRNVEPRGDGARVHRISGRAAAVFEAARRSLVIGNGWRDVGWALPTVSRDHITRSQGRLLHSARSRGRLLYIGTDAHEHADAVVPLLLEQARRHRGIDSAGHGDDDFAVSGHRANSIACGSVGPCECCWAKD